MHIIYIYYVIIKNMSYAPGLALGRRRVSTVSTNRLLGSLLYEDLLLVLLDHLVVLRLTNGYKVYQLVIYMHKMMIRHLVFRQHQLLK